MKIQKYLMAVAVIACGAFTSCNTDVERTCYEGTAYNVMFEEEEPSTITTAEDSYTVPVRVIRSNTKGEYTAHFSSIASEEGIFSDEGNGSVTFADGEGVTIINLTASNMEKGTLYTDTLVLSAADVANADTILKNQIDTCIVSIMCDYNWVSAGTCTFYDSWGEKSASGVVIKHAEGTNLYRIIDPMGTIYGASAAEVGGGDINFYLNDDYSISFDEGYMDYYYYYDGIGECNLYYSSQYANYCYTQNEDNVYAVTCLAYVPGYGLYAWGYFQFQWDEGWPGE